MEFELKDFETVIDVTRIANIHYFEFTRQYHTFEDKHPFCELVYVDNGYIYVKANNYSGIVNKNQLIIHTSEETHSLTCPSDIAPNIIIIGFECNSSRLDAFSLAPVTLSEPLQRLLSDIVREGRNVFLPPYDIPNLKDMKKRKEYLFGSDQMIKLKLETFFIELIREVSLPALPQTSLTDALASKTKDIHAYITENFREKITLNDLCFLYNTNKTSLCNHFRSVYGVTIINYLNQLRLTEAKRMLREGNFNLTEIAMQVGFSSIHYFSRVFKQYENCSPSDYIRTIKSKLML